MRVDGTGITCSIDICFQRNIVFKTDMPEEARNGCEGKPQVPWSNVLPNTTLKS
jgi:hypothetical protein